MKHAYLIIAFGDFYTLKRLIRSIDNPAGDIFLHLDASHTYKQDDLNALKNMTKYSQLNVYSEIKVKWGGKTLIECELFLMQKAKSGGYEYYHLMSGQDFLLKPVDQIQKFFNNCGNKEFLSVDTHPLGGESIVDRIDYYHYVISNRRITMILDHLITGIQRILHIHRVRHTKVMKQLAKGMEWASMTDDFVQCILEEKENIMRLAQHALFFDEMYKQMIYMKHKSEFEVYREIKFDPREQIMPRCQMEALATLHKVDWVRGNPYTYKDDDYEELIHSQCMFARKFNSNIDKKIIDRLYAYVSTK